MAIVTNNQQHEMMAMNEQPIRMSDYHVNIYNRMFPECGVRGYAAWPDPSSQHPGHGVRGH